MGKRQNTCARWVGAAKKGFHFGLDLENEGDGWLAGGAAAVWTTGAEDSQHLYRPPRTRCTGCEGCCYSHVGPRTLCFKTAQLIVIPQLELDCHAHQGEGN